MPPEADWDLLAGWGLPLVAAGVPDEPWDAGALRRHVELAARELREKADLPDRDRKREALGAFLLALRLHFPSVYADWFGDAALVEAALPSVPSGRVIKLVRIARRFLAERL